jgi:streptogramin lyase
LLIADVFAFRAVDSKTGEVRDIFRAQDSKLAYPGAIGLGSKLIALSSWSTGTVQLIDRASKQDVEMLHDLKAPMDAIPLDDGSLLIAEIATGSIVRASGAQYADRTVLAKDLAGPTQMILGKDGALYLTEAAGRLTKIDLSSGAKSVIAEGLLLPEGLAETPWKTFIVAEGGAQRLTEIDPSNGSKRSVAEGLPIGLQPGLPGMPPSYIATGVAVSNDGAVFVSADLNQSLLRIRPL